MVSNMIDLLMIKTVPIETSPEQEKPLHKNEGIKAESAFLRGSIAEGLADTSTGALADSDTQLTKFHGIYQQDDRGLRKDSERFGDFVIRKDYINANSVGSDFHQNLGETKKKA